ncbi:glycosyltransferase family 1 protein [Bacteroidetes/Chlorobi group bacterium ChocPot_Mid]|nr:MAG: glycosyltransferase family 1 protein [Bacteroidetes/Chlorobi group bacterium ChocPot_Mid]
MVSDEKVKVMFWRTEFYGALTEGGTVSLHVGKIRGFQKLGHEVFYVSSGPMKLPEGVKLYQIPYSKLYRNFPEVLHPNYNRRSINAIIKIIEKEQPNFLHKHHHDFHYGGAWLKKHLGLPFILHVDGIEYWVKKNWGKLYFSHLLRWAEDTELEASDAIIVISDSLKRQLVEYGVNGDKIHVVPNGVHPDQFYPEIGDKGLKKSLGLEDRFIVGYTGTFGRWHGVEVLAESVKHIVKRIPNAVVMFVGDGDLRPKIEEITKRDGVFDKIMITGFVPFTDIPHYLSMFDVAVSPCINNDDNEFFNSPVKLFEYMAMGKPIVASSVGQQGVVIENGVNGLLHEEKQPEELAERIFEIYSNKDLADRLGKEARRRAIEKHDWKFNAQAILDAYKGVVGKK